MEKRSGRIAAGVILISLTLLVKCIIVFPLLYIQAIRDQIRSDLHNPIIDHRFPGWHKELLHPDIAGSTLKLPADWRLETGEELAVYDGTGKQIAFGKSRVTVKYPPGSDLSYQWPTDYVPSDEEIQQVVEDLLASWVAPDTVSDEEISGIVSDHYGSEVVSETFLDSQHIFEGPHDWYEYSFTLESGQTVRLLYILFEYSVRDSDEVLYGVLFFEDPDDALRETATAIIYAAAGCIWTIYW